MKILRGVPDAPDARSLEEVGQKRERDEARELGGIRSVSSIPISSVATTSVPSRMNLVDRQVELIALDTPTPKNRDPRRAETLKSLATSSIAPLCTCANPSVEPAATGTSSNIARPRFSESVRPPGSAARTTACELEQLRDEKKRATTAESRRSVAAERRWFDSVLSVRLNRSQRLLLERRITAVIHEHRCNAAC